MTIFRSLSSDDSDMIRVICIQNISMLCKRFNKEDNQRLLVAHIKSLATDKSWRVRLT